MAHSTAKTKPTRQYRRFATKASRHADYIQASVLRKLGNIRTMTDLSALLEVN